MLLDKKRIFTLIANVPYTDLIDFLLSRCNLNQRELALVYARAKEGISQEKYAEMIGCSPRNLQRIEDKAFTKIIKNWAELDFLNVL